MRRTIPCVVAAVLAAASLAGAEEPLTLTRALELARTGPAVAEAAALVDRAAAIQEEARSAWRPRIEASVSDRFLGSDPGFIVPKGSFGNPVDLPLIAGQRNVWRASIGLQQLIWDAGRTHALLEAAGEGQAAAKARSRAVIRAIDMGTLSAYREAAVAAELLRVTEAAVAEYRALVGQVTALVEAEQLPLADQLQAKAAYEAARLERIRVRSRLDGALAVLEELTGRPVKAVAHLPDLPDAPDRDWIAEALAHRQELEALTRQAAALEHRAEAARAQHRPVLGARAAIQHREDDYLLHKDNAVVGIGLTLPIFDGGLASARAAEMEAAAREAQARRDRLERQVRREVRMALIRLDAARAAVQTATAARDAATESLRQAGLRYREELITVRELLEVEADAVRAREALKEARTELMASRLALENVAGGDLLALVGGGTEEANHE